METRLKYGIQVIGFELALVGFLGIPAHAASDAPTPPTPSKSDAVVSQADAHLRERLLLSDKGPEGTARVQLTTDQPLAGPGDEVGHRASTPKGPVATQPCGYYSLSAEELASPGVWAGALQANTGTLVPGRFATAAISESQAAVPDNKKDLGVVPVAYECNGHRSIVYASALAPASRAPTPKVVTAAQRQAAEELVATISVPSFSIGINPDAQGITQLPSWFWLSGYDGSTLYRPAAPSSLGTGWLRATPISYLWSFGDGTPAVTTTSIGQAFPKASDITHTYRTRSDQSPFGGSAGLYHVSVTASFDVAFEVSSAGQSLVPNGTWIEFSSFGLPPLTASASRNYKVHEIVSVLTG